ncbi:MAG TPA: FCD domain-containing protein [Syntrophobacteria bacterium]|nr:FCD domain-containing protein [Syntrophobacteria bacterium]
MDSDRDLQAEALRASLLRNRRRIREIMQFRAVIEPEVAAMAAKSADERDLRILNRSIQDQEGQLSDAQAYVKRDLRFHMSLARASKNEVFLEVLAVVYEILAESRSFTLVSEGRMTTSFDHHVALVDAITKRDAERARRLMREHLAEVERQIEKEPHRRVDNSHDRVDR